METNQEKQTPFLKRVADLEKKVDSIENKLEIIIKSLRR
jgi:hypothetical protein